MSMVVINWKPDVRERRKFGLTMVIGCAVVGIAFHFLFAKPHVAVAWYIFGGVAGVLGLSGTKAVMPVYWAWMGFGFIMGNIVSRVTMAIIYYLLITPMGHIRRLAGHDDLQLRKTKNDSYWVALKRVADPSRYERQF